jgi:hypothetical protein
LDCHDQPSVHSGVEPDVVGAMDPSGRQTLTDVPVHHWGWPRMTWAGALCGPKTKRRRGPLHLSLLPVI